MMQRESAKDVIAEFSSELSMIRGKCMDLGCGPGDVTKELLIPRLQNDVAVVGKWMKIGHELGVSVSFIYYYIILGSDTSQYMTDYGNVNYADDKRLSFIVLDIEKTELPSEQNEQYDCVVSFSCLHWCQDLR